jgi:hypothetical protein
MLQLLVWNVTAALARSVAGVQNVHNFIYLQEQIHQYAFF